MLVEVVVSVHQFQRRWCWQLSSLLQRNPGVRVRVLAAAIKGTGEPTALACADHFRGLGLEVTLMEYPDTSRFQYRGLVRTDAVKQSQADWLVFTDADMVYPPDWFEKLAALSPTMDATKCSFTGRYSTLLNPTEKLVEGTVQAAPALVPTAWKLARGLPSKPMPNVGAGFCQIIGGDFMRKRGFYVKRSRDWNWEKRYSKCRSDIQFRRKVGHACVGLPWLVHLQHVRDSDFGSHTEVQR